MAADDLAGLPGVLGIWPVQQFSLPHLQSSQSWHGVGGSKPSSSSSNYSVHGITGVDQLHAKDIKGQGIVVGIIDTGIWYDHPDVSLAVNES
jgi:hypothetical protein